MALNRIAYAYYDPNWDRIQQPIALLVRTAIEPLDYLDHMKGYLHCPSCYEPLTRVPNDPAVAVMANGRVALFRHFPDEDAPYCRLRSSQMSGKKYNSEEEARQAVEDQDLVIISGFMQERPENQPRADFDGEQEPLETEFESEHGPEVAVPVSRHDGETFKLPSKVTSVQSLCTNFRHNYHREIHIVVEDKVLRYVLDVDLQDAAEIDDVTDEPKFYFGEIIRIRRFDSTSHVFLRHPHLPGNFDFRISANNNDLDARGITAENSLRRILIFYGVIAKIGAGYWSPNKKWGEIALLPRQYDDFLKANYQKKEA
jgi:hypothetical protein